MERKKKYKEYLIHILWILMVGLIIYAYALAFSMRQEQSCFQAEENEEIYLMPVGKPVGLYVHTEGVLVLGSGKIESFSGTELEPAAHVFESGDYILAIDQIPVKSTSQVVQLIQESEGKMIHFTVNRNRKKIDIMMAAQKTKKGHYRVGLWLRDDTQGIGTITYLKKDQSFAALGHGITDIDTGTLLDINYGMVYDSQILNVIKGKAGEPGELLGRIEYLKNHRIGSITANKKNGIFGFLKKDALMYDYNKALPVAGKDEIKEGKAYIYCALDGEPSYYEIELTAVKRYQTNNGKDIVLQITDERLLERTNGILQGMSGSPIVQDGKIAGAVTHVFVNDPTRGYGIFIEEMLP